MVSSHRAQALFTWPQSVGISGGRPSSSYYFVGAQADSLFYLDPHHTRPTIPLRSPQPPASAGRWEPDPTSDETIDRNRPSTSHIRSPTSPSSVKTGSSAFSYHAPLSPSPLHRQLSLSSSSNASIDSAVSSSQPHPAADVNARHAPSNIPRQDSPSGSRTQPSPTEIDVGDGHLDPLNMHYVNSYSAAELRTFHCERVRKLPLNGMDPSMLLGFLCRDEQDWIDFKSRVADVSCLFALEP